MEMIIPPMDSWRTDQAQQRRMTIVMGIAAMVRPNSASTKLMMMTSDCTSYPRTEVQPEQGVIQKKKSNFKKVTKI
jgi:hypothetical protein